MTRSGETAGEWENESFARRVNAFAQELLLRANNTASYAGYADCYDAYSCEIV